MASLREASRKRDWTWGIGPVTLLASVKAQQWAGLRRWVFDNMDMNERSEKMRASRLAGEARFRGAKHWSQQDRIEGIEKRLPERYRTNATIKRLIGLVNSDYIRYKLNEDGSPMTAETELEFRRRHGMAIPKKLAETLGLTVGEKPAKGQPITAKELEELRQFVSDDEYQALKEQLAA